MIQSNSWFDPGNSYFSQCLALCSLSRAVSISLAFCSLSVVGALCLHSSFSGRFQVSLPVCPLFILLYDLLRIVLVVRLGFQPSSSIVSHLHIHCLASTSYPRLRLGKVSPCRRRFTLLLLFTHSSLFFFSLWPRKKEQRRSMFQVPRSFPPSAASIWVLNSCFVICSSII